MDSVYRLSHALEKLQSENYQAVLLDLGLPDATGLEAVHQVQAAAPELPIVVMTNLEDEEVVQRALQLGVQDYLVKGHIHRLWLARIITYAIERKRATSVLHGHSRFVTPHTALPPGSPVVIGGETGWGETSTVTTRSNLTSVWSINGTEDRLSGLASHMLLMDRLHRALEQCQRNHESSFAVMFIDLDVVRIINEASNYPSGDRLLDDIFECLKKALRPEDTLTCFGGNEFIVLLERLASSDEAQHIAESLQRAVAKPFKVEDMDVFIRLNIGIAIGTPQHVHAHDLLHKAEAAMFRAKKSGKHNHIAIEAALVPRS
ncbi:MAG: GGDEF domain-containing response regulator [Myxococcota bacterium]